MSTVKSVAGTSEIEEIVKNLNAAGIPPDFGANKARLLIQVWRALALGQPVAKARIEQISHALQTPYEEADDFLRQVSERDYDDNIIGLVGLSLNQDWAHSFNVNGNPLRTWCAWDALFLPPTTDAG